MSTFNASPTNLTVHLSHVTAAATEADQYWHLHRSDCINKLIYAHTTLRTVPTGDISLGSLTLPAPEAGDFVELILQYPYVVSLPYSVPRPTLID